MSGTFPSDPAPSSVSLESSQPVAVDYAESGKRQARILGAHLWKIKMSWPVLTKAMISPIIGFVQQQRIGYESFLITLPNYSTPLGVATGTPLVDSNTAAGSTSVVIKDWTFSQTGIMKAGDIFKFADHSKVYMLTADCDSDGAGLATLLFQPPLIMDVSANESIIVSNVQFRVCLDDDVATFKGSAPNMMQISANFTESL